MCTQGGRLGREVARWSETAVKEIAMANARYALIVSEPCIHYFDRNRTSLELEWRHVKEQQLYRDWGTHD
jgi:hypothetical protein